MSTLTRSYVMEPLSREERLARLETGNFRPADWAPDILPQVNASLVRTLLLAKILTPEELGHPDGATWREIMASARKRKLGFVPQRLVPSLRLAYTSRHPNDYVRIVHRPVVGPGGREFRFAFRDEGQLLWLHARETGGDEAFWPADFQFMFMWAWGRAP